MNRPGARLWLWTLILLLGLPTGPAALGQTAGEAGKPAPRVRVRATGQAPADLPNARESAIDDALRRCVEAAGGLELQSASQSEDYVLAADYIFARSAGFIEKYEVLEENPDQEGLWTVRVSAVVTRGQVQENFAAFKVLMQRKGRPRVAVVGSADGKPFDDRLTAQLQGVLERKGVRVVDAARLTEVQKADAARAAKGDENLKKAALIAQQLNADVLAVITLEGERLPAEEAYGQRMFRVDTFATVKLIRADTAEVLGSEIGEGRSSGDNPEAAARRAGGDAATKAMNAAVRRIAAHWLEDLDQRGGQEIAVVLHQFAFARTAALVEKLRQVPGVKDVAIDRTDAEALGQIRVVTNSSAADVAAVLGKLDEKLQVISTSGNRIDVK